MESKNEKLLIEFIDYCKEHPEMRFWQALRNWCGADFIYYANTERAKKSGYDEDEIEDTFYWEGKDS